MGESQSTIDIATLFRTAHRPVRPFRSIELFAGAGGMALGMEHAGIEHLLLNDFDRYAAATLRRNRPQWPIVHGDVAEIDFTPFADKVDVLTGGFPCQAFSYAGKKMGLEDTRGTLFYEFARALKETRPALFLAENVRGLLSHDTGRTLKTILSVFRSMGYRVLEPTVLKAIKYRVPQKRERLIIVGIREDYADKVTFSWPEECTEEYTLKDALKKGTLYPSDVPPSPGQTYPEKKKAILEKVPPGGYWRDLPIEDQKAYMMKSFTSVAAKPASPAVSPGMSPVSPSPAPQLRNRPSGATPMRPARSPSESTPASRRFPTNGSSKAPSPSSTNRSATPSRSTSPTRWALRLSPHSTRSRSWICYRLRSMKDLSH